MSTLSIRYVGGAHVAKIGDDTFERNGDPGDVDEELASRLLESPDWEPAGKQDEPVAEPESDEQSDEFDEFDEAFGAE